MTPGSSATSALRFCTPRLVSERTATSMPASSMALRRSAPRSSSRPAPSPWVDSFSARSLQRGIDRLPSSHHLGGREMLFASDDLHRASPCTLQNLTSFAWTLRNQKLGHKEVLYAEVPIRNTLLSVIAQHRFESFAISPYAIGPPIFPEYGDIFLNQLAEPGEHRVHVVEDKAKPVFVFRSFLGITEALL